MRRKFLLAILPLLVLTACAIGLVLHIVSQACILASWLCDGHSMARDLQIMLVLMMLPFIASLGWGIGKGLHLWLATSRMMQSILALPRRPLPDTLVSVAAQLGVGDKVDVVDDPGPEVFCYGLFRPRILLTTGLLARLSVDEVEAVLYHERHHLQRRDPLRAWLWSVLDALCWWDEVDREAARLQRELAADRAAIAAGRRYSLARALLKLLSTDSSLAMDRAALAITGLSVTEARIDQIVHPELAPTVEVSRTGLLLFPAAAVLAILACAVVITAL